MSCAPAVNEDMKPLSRIVEELVPGYLEARKEEVPQMLALLEASDFERLRVLSHSLKGSGGSFGFSELSRFGATLERFAESSNRSGFREELARLEDYLEHVEWPRLTVGATETRAGARSSSPQKTN